jgi:hypothetical protein
VIAPTDMSFMKIKLFFLNSFSNFIYILLIKKRYVKQLINAKMKNMFIIYFFKDNNLFPQTEPNIVLL